MHFKLLHSNKEKIETLRYCYLNFYAKNYFDKFLIKKINEWNKNSNLVKNENGKFFYKESLIQIIKI